jgi:hypothetical protein
MIIGFDNRELLPAVWREMAHGRRVRAFNPALIRENDGWLFAYRMVIEPELKRQIALCRLDQNLRVMNGTQVPFTDWIRFPGENKASQATTWFADPRLYRLGGRLFIYWNSGWHEPQNQQFLHEVDPISLRPLGAPRELVLSGPRQKLEKNWSLFEHDGRVYGIYSVNPHRVLSLSMADEGVITCTDVEPPMTNAGGYAQAHGGLRGGAPPCKLGDHFYSFCHSIENDPVGYRYVAAVYRFQARPPFAPTDMARAPLSIEVPADLRRQLPKLNEAVGNVLYPAGAVYHEGNWMLSIGIDDERCAIALLNHQEVLETLAPIR